MLIEKDNNLLPKCSFFEQSLNQIVFILFIKKNLLILLSIQISN